MKVGVCEVQNGVSQKWEETKFDTVAGWQAAFNGQGVLVSEPSLTGCGILGFRLVDPPNENRFFLVDPEYIGCQTC